MYGWVGKDEEEGMGCWVVMVVVEVVEVIDSEGVFVLCCRVVILLLFFLVIVDFKGGLLGCICWLFFRVGMVEVLRVEVVIVWWG